MKISFDFQDLTTSASIGATALMAAMPAGLAHAQETMSITIDGGASSSDFSELFFEQKGGSDFEIGADNGFFGSVAVSQKISDAWDWRVSGSLLGFSENTVRSDDQENSLTQRLTAVTADGDIGRHLVMGQTQLRVGFGLLTTRYDQSSDFGDGKISFDTSIEYRGTGPKVSLDLVHPVSPDDRLSLIGGASLAATSGEFALSASSEGTSVDGSALLSAAYVGVSVQRNESTEFRAGLRLDKFDSDVEGEGEGESFGIAGGNVSTTTAFVGLRISF